MAASFADRPLLPPGDADGTNDPFVSPSAPAHHRYSNFDSQLFALGPASSPGQAKRALEAHLAETERRMEEAGKLGTALVQQRKELAERLKEVDKLQAEGDLTDELRTKLTEIEKEYNDVARETARAFLPKQRVPSNETAGGSPYVPEGRGGRRSVSPSKFESQATGSPTKLSVPNRKIRNQPSNRVHDIEFAAEISTSLLAQVRNLQSLLAEKDEELRDTKAERSRLEIETEGFQQRVKTLDESEHRYKDENWNLETQIHELMASQKEGTDREKKMTQALNILQAEKNQAQKELDEVKLSHAKLAEEHEASVKHHDIELGTAKRSAALAETERTTLQRKIDDLMGQNQELAKAFSSQRGRGLERDQHMGMSDEDFDTATDNVTPEHSPPPSPIKGTPRHSMLESETLKTSLLHAQRTIQSQRSQLHREKTEKLELKRLLQDSRDELEKSRHDAGGVSGRRSRKVDSKEFKKPSKTMLGSLRSSRSEIIVDDPEWEEHSEGVSPRRSSTHSTPTTRRPGSGHAPGAYPMTTDTSDQFDTANETSDAAFETANERGTETEGFHTGAEEFSDDDDAQTETESPSRSRRPPNLMLAGNRNSFHSTASTSADEDLDYGDLRTPVAHSSQQKMRLKSSRGFLNRRSRQPSEEPAFQSSPASFATSSANGTPQAAGQSLFAELAELDGSDVESLDATPSRRARSVTPASAARSYSNTPSVLALPQLAMVDSGIMTDPVKKDRASRGGSPDLARPRPLMVDCGVMTDPVDTLLSPTSPVSVVALERPTSSSSMLDAGAQHDPDMDRELSQFPLPPTMQQAVVPPPAPRLSFSAIDDQVIAPVQEPEVPPPPPAALSFTPVDSTTIEPRADPEPAPAPAPALRLSPILSETVEPKAVPEPVLGYSPLVSAAVEPVAEPEVILPAPVLGLSSIWSEGVEPKAAPEIVPPPPPPAPVLALSAFVSESIEPMAEPEVLPTPPPALALSAVVSESIEPKAEPEVLPPPPPPAPQLVFSYFVSEAIEPRAEPDVPAPAAPILSLSALSAHNIEPRAEPEVKPIVPVLALSGIVSEHVEPQAEADPVPTPLRLSGLESWEVVPRVGSKPIPPSLTLSSVVSEEIEPVTPALPDTLAPNFAFSAIDSIETHPVSPRTPKRDGFILPRGMESPFANADQPRTPNNALFGAVSSRGQTDANTVIAEDETRQSPSDARHPDTPDSQRPFKEISSNAEARPARKPAVAMSDQSAQTSLTAGAIDEMFSAKARGHDKSLSMGSSFGTPGTVRVRRFSQDQESVGSARRMSIEPQGDMAPPPRPGSASSRRGSFQQPMPPLPQNHREVIEAARSGSAHGTPGTASIMGPPLWPASAMRGQRPQTPSSVRPQSAASASTSVKGTPTPKAVRTGSGAPVHGSALIHSPTKASARSRRSSVSSFASEIDTRFNIRANGLGVDAAGFGPNTDPRMIQAITQTMIGEYLWKYTRKAGRGQMSENRHRRYFWVHPYTRTLYWSDRDPSSAGRADMKAKSVSIEAVRVVTDDNPMPPGLHRKSLIVISPGRQIKFTCTTGQRHETWFNALSYLLLRTHDEGQTDAEEMAGHITQEDVDEFNPQIGGVRPTPSATPSTRPRMAPSLSSYNSRTTRNQSPAMDLSMDVPRLTPTPHKTASGSATPQRPSIGTLGRLSGYWKNSQVISGTFSSLRSRTVSGQGQQGNSIYEASEVHDSAEDVREMIERQDREADRLENVRACCDVAHTDDGDDDACGHQQVARLNLSLIEPNTRDILSEQT
ncbi:hypothetical protein ACHAQA_007649 [Verticillium albo-atrum]